MEITTIEQLGNTLYVELEQVRVLQQYLTAANTNQVEVSSNATDGMVDAIAELHMKANVLIQRAIREKTQA